jgi:hypothetical protein
MQPMTINNLLKKNTSQLRHLFEDSKDGWCEKAPDGKWTAGQHVVHLAQSTDALLKGISYPGFILKWKFGKNNRDNRSYDDVVTRYNEKLQNLDNGVTSPFSKNMPVVTQKDISNWLDKLELLNHKLASKTLSKSDKDLDTILIPHPLMGRMTMREILMWNAYHTDHHFQILNTKYINL